VARDVLEPVRAAFWLDGKGRELVRNAPDPQARSHIA
jgi:hypothetical protein